LQIIFIGVDPKSIVCEFFKKGLCDKGPKCKYSHVLADDRKSEKPDLYTDLRSIAGMEGGPAQTKGWID
jgi:hypothetical protein